MKDDLYSRRFRELSGSGSLIPDPYAWAVASTRLRTWDVDGNEMVLPGPSLPVDLAVVYLGAGQDVASLSGRNVRELSVIANAGYVHAVRDYELEQLDVTTSQLRCFEQFVYTLQKYPSATLLIG